MNIFGVGAGEALLVLVIALIVVGPGRFPEIARQAGRWYRLARRYTSEVMTDVRAAVDELEQEVTRPEDDLRSIREIGTELSSDLSTTSAELDEVGRETQAAAEGTGAATAGDEPAGERDTTPAPAASAGAEPQTARTPAEPSAPVSIRPSKRTKAAGTDGPVDPFEALEARRARERERRGDGRG
ncbi:MAG: twin-arginine translocase TatA/TatE family subunit [Chloroflexi bacterium]|nr:twin-arginine translocase TatA/TatE family subunit [Chloroflexota bacterium]